MLVACDGGILTRALAENSKTRPQTPGNKAALPMTATITVRTAHHPGLIFSGRASCPRTENTGISHVMQLSGTTLTKRNGPLGHLNNAYVGLARMPECSDGSKTVTLKRHGDYEVRLIDFSQGRSTVDCLFGLELYCCLHDPIVSRQLPVRRSRRDAQAAADYLVSRAKQLYDESGVNRWAAKFDALLRLAFERPAGQALRRDLERGPRVGSMPVQRLNA